MIVVLHVGILTAFAPRILGESKHESIMIEC